MSFFIEVGACDFDTCEQLIHYGWKGIVIEPVKYYYDKLTKYPQIHYENIAISDEVGTSKFNLNTFFPSSGSSLKDIIKNDIIWNITRRLFSFNPLKTFKTIEVETSTIDIICNKNNINKIDVLKIDTEGYEYFVLFGQCSICHYHILLPNQKIYYH